MQQEELKTIKRKTKQSSMIYSKQIKLQIWLCYICWRQSIRTLRCSSFVKVESSFWVRDRMKYIGSNVTTFYMTCMSFKKYLINVFKPKLILYKRIWSILRSKSIDFWLLFETNQTKSKAYSNQEMTFLSSVPWYRILKREWNISM